MRATLPDCNSKWTQARGAEVWCTALSGGVKRDWVGLPRLYRQRLDPVLNGTGADAPERCVCAPAEVVAQAPPFLVGYNGCDAASESCIVPQKAL